MVVVVCVGVWEVERWKYILVGRWDGYRMDKNVNI